MIAIEAAAIGMVVTFIAGLLTCYGWLSQASEGGARDSSAPPTQPKK